MLSDQKSLAKTLLEHKADVNKKDSRGRHLLHIAINRGEFSVWERMKRGCLRLQSAMFIYTVQTGPAMVSTTELLTLAIVAAL